MKRIALGIATLVVAGGVAFAQPVDQKTAADEYTKGNTAYNLGRFDEAVDHFTKAYEAWSQPEFLYNIAQSYRLGGNCKQAVYFYKRFRSLKEKDTTAPLSEKKSKEIDKFIGELSDCAAKADSGANVQPQSLDQPAASGGATTQPTTAAAPATPTSATATRATTADKPSERVANNNDADEDGGEEQVTEHAAHGANVVSARLESGVALLGGGGGLTFPAQPTVSLSGGYPLAAGPAVIELGAGFSYVPLPYDVMGAQKRGALVGARAQVVAAYPVASNVWLRANLGAGVASLSGLEMGNPITTDRSARSFTLLNVRAGVAADYDITPNIVVTLQPFAFGYSPGADGMYASSLHEIDVLIGLGYRK